MPLSHSALFRDPTEPAGFDLRPQYPLTGPFVYYDTRDHDHGATGYTVVSPGTPGPFNSTGMIPNQGAAGSIADMPVFQNSRWRVDYGMAEYNTTGEIDSFDFDTPPFSYIDSITGGPPSNGPYLWILASGEWDDPDMIDGTGDRRGFVDCVYQLIHRNAALDQQQSVFRPELDWGGGTPATLTVDIHNTFWSTVLATGDYGPDVIRNSSFTLNIDAYTGQLNNRLFIDMVDIVTGLADWYVNGKWFTDHLDGDLGISNLIDDFIYEEWWNLPPLSATSARDDQRIGERFGTAADVDAGMFDIRNWFVNTGQNTIYNNPPVEGQPWPGFRAMGLWRGTPTAADLAAIAADMGVSV